MNEILEKEKCLDFNYFLNTYIKLDYETTQYIKSIEHNKLIDINSKNEKAIQAMSVWLLHRHLFGPSGLHIGILAKTLKKASKYNLNMKRICEILPDFLWDKNYYNRQSKFLRRSKQNNYINFGGVMLDYSNAFPGFRNAINIVDLKNSPKKGIKQTLLECLIHSDINSDYQSDDDIKIFILNNQENISVILRDEKISTEDFYKIGYTHA